MPNSINFGGQLQPPAAPHQNQQSQILGQLLAQQQPQQEQDPFAGMKAMLFQQALIKNRQQEQEQQQVANQVAGGFLQNQPRPPGVQLQGGL